MTYVTAGAVAVVLVILVVYYFTTLYAQNPQIGKTVTSEDYSALYGIARSASYGPVNSTISLAVKAASGSTYFHGGKPIVVYIGADYCPYCAFTRWPLTVALMRFGNFSGLGYMQSSSTDVFASTDTFTYYNSSYSSPYVVFQPFEAQTRGGQALQSVPSNYTTVMDSYSSGYPFLDVANKFVVSGALYYPTFLGNGLGGNWTKDIQNIGNNNTKLSYQVMSEANLITELICKETGGKPASVCSNPSITGYSPSIVTAAYVSSPSASLTTGNTSTSATMWSIVQNRQISPRTKTSA